jgi:hypothetical protein
MRPAFTLVISALAACAGTTSEQLATCTLQLTVPAEATAGAPASFGLTPISDRWDIVAHVAGQPAPVLAAVSTDCEACDACRADNLCGACDSATADGACAACIDACATCTPTVTLQMPDVAPGAWPIVVVNRYGQSAAAVVNLLASPLDESNDSGAPVGP